MHWIRNITFAFGLVAQSQFAIAGNVSEFIFDESLLTKMPSGSLLEYAHSLTTPEGSPLKAFEDGQINLLYDRDEGGSGQVLIEFDSAARSLKMKPLPTVGGNPLVMVFLENTARAMSNIAGGSPFYIRNRMKNALMTGGETSKVAVAMDGKDVELTQVTLLPFALDPNRARMGQFAFLEVSFIYDDAVPGGIQMLRAFVPDPASDNPLYEETITFSSQEVPK